MKLHCPLSMVPQPWRMLVSTVFLQERMDGDPEGHSITKRNDHLIVGQHYVEWMDCHGRRLLSFSRES